MDAIDVVQGSTEWLDARRGKVTASRICDVLAKKDSAGRNKYKLELVAERLTHWSTSHYVSDEMLWGIETEPSARGAYEMLTGIMTDTIGIVFHPSIENAAASPDGLVGDDGLIEIKCPNTITHLDYMEKGIPTKYAAQMLWQMACTGRKWGDFVSYDPRLRDADLALYVKRLPRDDKWIAGTELEVIQFLKEVDQSIERLKSQLKMSSVLA